MFLYLPIQLPACRDSGLYFASWLFVFSLLQKKTFIRSVTKFARESWLVCPCHFSWLKVYSCYNISGIPLFHQEAEIWRRQCPEHKERKTFTVAMPKHSSASTQPIVAGKVLINKRIWKKFCTVFQLIVNWMIRMWSQADSTRLFEKVD